MQRDYFIVNRKENLLQNEKDNSKRKDTPKIIFMIEIYVAIIKGIVNNV